MKYLVRFSSDWADEFQAEGLAIYSEEEKAKLERLLESSNFEWYFGTNEGFEAGELEVDDFIFTPISDEELAVISKFIPDLNTGFGQIPNVRWFDEPLDD